MFDYNLEFIKRYKILIGTLVLMSVLLLSFYLFILDRQIRCNDLDYFITIPKGSSATSVGILLKENECIENLTTFKLAVKMTMNTKHIRPGRYDLKGISSMRQLIKKITSQPGDLVKTTIIEGWNIEQIADELYGKLKIDRDKFMRLCKDENFLNELDIKSESLEGFIFPDTYFLLKYYTEKEILELLVNQFKSNYQKIINNGDGMMNFTMQEIVTLASIIQGEAMYVDEMPLISSVYHNRLKKNMLLQADPTIQYIIPGKPRRLFNKDLEVDSPYNTYMYKGLPPGAINNPGIEAIKAAIYPDESKYFYFVSDGEGRHVFTQTVDQHNLAKLQLKRKRKAMAK